MDIARLKNEYKVLYAEKVLLFIQKLFEIQMKIAYLHPLEEHLKKFLA